MNFEEITGDERAAVLARPKGRGGSGRPKPLSLALASGAMVFVAATKNPVNNWARGTYLYGYRVHQRAAERDGVRGFYLWAEKPDKA
jgi:hypothetical protein